MENVSPDSVERLSHSQTPPLRIHRREDLLLPQALVQCATRDREEVPALAGQALDGGVGGFRLEIEIVVIEPADALALRDVSFSEEAIAPSRRTWIFESTIESHVCAAAREHGAEELEESLHRILTDLELPLHP